MTEQCRPSTAVPPCGSKYFERSALFRTEEVANSRQLRQQGPHRISFQRDAASIPGLITFSRIVQEQTGFLRWLGKCSEASPAGNFFVERVEKSTDNRTSQCSATATGASSASTLSCGNGKSVVIGPGDACTLRRGQRLRYVQLSPARSPIPILTPLPLHGNAGRIADLDPHWARTGSIGAVYSFLDLSS